MSIYVDGIRENIMTGGIWLHTWMFLSATSKGIDYDGGSGIGHILL